MSQNVNQVKSNNQVLANQIAWFYDLQFLPN